MTYAYVTRAWALEKMGQCIFGRDTIADAIGAPARTVSSWYRQDIRRAPLALKTPREDPRALALALLHHYPKRVDEIAFLLSTKPRTIMEWRQIKNEKRFTTDLFVRTRQLAGYYRVALLEYVDINAAGKIVLTQGRFPSPYPIYEIIWQGYDDNLSQILNAMKEVHVLECLQSLPSMKAGLDLDPELMSSLKSDLKRMLGPHKLRGLAIKSDIYEDFQDETAQRRVVGRFNDKSPHYMYLPQGTLRKRKELK